MVRKTDDYILAASVNVQSFNLFEKAEKQVLFLTNSR